MLCWCRNENGTFASPSGLAPFPYATSALPLSIVSPQWADLNASTSGEILLAEGSFSLPLMSLGSVVSH